MERVVTARGESGVDVEEIADAADLGGEDDHVVAEAVAFGGSCGLKCAGDHGFNHDVARGQRLGALAVRVHHAGEQALIERTPVDADADGLLIFDGALDHGAEVVVVFAADGHVAGIDTVLGECAGGGRVFLEQEMAVVVEVADDGDAEAALFEAFDDVRNGGGGILIIDCDAHQLRAGESKGSDLGDGGFHVGRVGVGHGLNDDGNFPAYADVADADGGGFSAANLRHEDSLQWIANG